MALLKLATQVSKAADVLVTGWRCPQRSGRSGADSAVGNEHVARAVVAFATWSQQVGSLVAIVEYRVPRDLPAIVDVIGFLQVEP